MAEMMQYKNNSTPTIGKSTIEHYYDKVGIEAANVKNVYAQFASRKWMPLKTGKTFKISRWQHIFDRKLGEGDFAQYGFLSSRNIADVTTTLTAITLEEGAGKKNLVDFAKVTMETTCKRYGEMMEYTDELDMFHEDEVMARMHEELGLLANQRHEDLLQRDMLATNNVLYSGLATNLDTMGNGLQANGTLDDKYRISYDLIRTAVRKLKRNRAEKHTSLVTGSVKVDTRTVNAAYYAIIGPEVQYDLEMLTRGKGNVEEYVFIPVHKYASASNLAEGEIGQVHDVRFVLSESAMVYRNKGANVPASYTGTLSYTGTAGSDGKFDVFPILFPTKEAFATVGLKGHNKVEFRGQSPKAKEMANPYGTKGWLSYNFWYASIILQEEKLLKVLVLASK